MGKKISLYTNNWGIALPPGNLIVEFPQSLSLVRKMLFLYFNKELSVDTIISDEFLEYLFTQLNDDADNIENSERCIRRRLQDMKIQKRISETLASRAKLIERHIRPFIVGETVLDCGCGDGLIAQRLNETYHVDLTDIIDYRLPSLKGLPFCIIKDGKELPYKKKQFDTTLLLTVMHHSEHPRELLKEVTRITKQRIIIIESVFDVDTNETLLSVSTLRTALKDQCGTETFFSLTTMEQLAYCSFIDWFYNRILHEGIPTPYNYNSPQKWRKIFESAQLKEIHQFHLGFDEPAVPEYHTLHIVEPV